MAAYVIFKEMCFDPERYDEYKTKATACIVRTGGKYIVRDPHDPRSAARGRLYGVEGVA